MENKGLLFIPDISGFTRFVNESEIEHSRYIIQELLEVLMNANELGLQVSEIEGDAILFYRFGEPPAVEEIYNQVEKMFCAFHKNLVAYERRRYCQCQACLAATNLTLKVITHYGEFTGYNVKQFNKLIGRDIIIAHQLLKNDIALHEYWLITPVLTDMQSPPGGLKQWMTWKASSKDTEAGTIPFFYTQLSQLKNEIAEERLLEPDLSTKTKAISVSKEYETDIIKLFHATGDFNYRSRWFEGIRHVEEVGHLLPRIGMRCRCVLDSGETVIYSSSYSYQQDKIRFSETAEAEDETTYFTLEKINNNKIRLTIDRYIKKNVLSEMIYRLFKKAKKEKALQRSLENLGSLLQEINL